MNTTKEMDRVFFIAVPQDVAQMIDSFPSGTSFGTMRMVDNNSTLTLDPSVMEKYGFNRNEYSCIYTLSKNAGSKYVRVFSDSYSDNTIVFDGSCKVSLSARANPQTKQFQESILRIKRKQNPEMEMHFLSEKERRELNALRRDERDKNKRESRAHWKKERCVVYVKRILLMIISLLRK